MLIKNLRLKSISSIERSFPPDCVQEVSVTIKVRGNTNRTMEIIGILKEDELNKFLYDMETIIAGIDGKDLEIK